MTTLLLDREEVHATRAGTKRLHITPTKPGDAFLWRPRPGQPDTPIVVTVRARPTRKPGEPSPETLARRERYGMQPYRPDPAFNHTRPNRLPPAPAKPVRVQIVAAELVTLHQVLDLPSARAILGDKTARLLDLKRWWLSHHDPIWALKLPHERRTANQMVVDRDFEPWKAWQVWRIAWEKAEERRFIAAESDGGIVDSSAQAFPGEPEAVPEDFQQTITDDAQPSIIEGTRKGIDKSFHAAVIAAARHKESYRAKRARRAPAITPAIQRRRQDAQ